MKNTSPSEDSFKNAAKKLKKLYKKQYALLKGIKESCLFIATHVLFLFVLFVNRIVLFVKTLYFVIFLNKMPRIAITLLSLQVMCSGADFFCFY